jgi:hypothetical protein
MVDTDVNLLLILLLLVPSLAFMFWVIWALEKQIRREKSHSDVIARAKVGSDRPAPTSAALEKRNTGSFTGLKGAAYRT